jgi:hypothetical protein
MSQSRHVSSYWRSIACLGLDRIDDALDWIEKACEEHDVWLVWLKAEPRFDAIRSDARFDRALRELGLRSRVRANGL